MRAAPQPRQARTRTRVLAAVSDILIRKGYASLTIEGVAAHSGVAKTTIYRRWPTKASLCVDLYLEAASSELIDPQTGDVAADLRKIVATAVHLQTRTVAGPALLGLLAEAQLNPDAGGALLQEFAETRRRVTREVLRRAIEKGQIRPDTDIDLIIDLLGGASIFRLLQRHAPLDRKFVQSAIALILDGCRT
jgi:AcrR family transcriptional regulator